MIKSKINRCKKNCQVLVWQFFCLDVKSENDSKSRANSGARSKDRAELLRRWGAEMISIVKIVQSKRSGGLAIKKKELRQTKYFSIYR